jgi:hypothetical protein
MGSPVTELSEVCIASDFEYDGEFIALLEGRLHGLGRSTYVVWPHNLAAVLKGLADGAIGFRYLVDRASNTSPEFLQLHAALLRSSISCLDDPRTMLWASDKATMHLEFLAAGIQVPYTLIVPSRSEDPRPQLTGEALAPLGFPFVIKPANSTGGGRGVLPNGRSVADVEEARREFPSDKYLVQEKIYPAVLGDRRFWFRAVHSCGLVQCFWWNDLDHHYRFLEEEEIDEFHLQPLSQIMQRIARVCALRLFSSEIVLDPRGRFVVVDYINETPDLRSQSSSPDGVPDESLHRVAQAVAVFIHAELTPRRGRGAPSG